MSLLTVLLLQEIAGIDLNTGQIGGADQLDMAAGADRYRSLLHLWALFLCQHEIVIHAVRQSHLRMLTVDALADRLRLPEIQRRALYRHIFAGRRKLRIHRCNCIGVELQ